MSYTLTALYEGMNEWMNKFLEYFPYPMNLKFPSDDFHLAKFGRKWVVSVLRDSPRIPSVTDKGLTLARWSWWLHLEHTFPIFSHLYLVMIITKRTVGTVSKQHNPLPNFLAKRVIFSLKNCIELGISKLSQKPYIEDEDFYLLVGITEFSNLLTAL